MEIEVFDETRMEEDKNIDLVYDILQFAADYIDLENNPHMTVILCDNERIKELNKEYRDKDAPTDVLSFAILDEGNEEFPIDLSAFKEMPLELGDIFVSRDKANEQAQEYGHTYQRELGFLVVHGFLHLNGYDHIEKDDEKEMFALQDSILEAYGLER